MRHFQLHALTVTPPENIAECNVRFFLFVLLSFLIFSGCTSTLNRFNSRPDSYVNVIKKIQPSIVSITTFDQNGNTLKRGSGFFISSDGDVITNSHVLQDAVGIQVKTFYGENYSCNKILAEDIESDLVKINVDLTHRIASPIKIQRSVPVLGERIIVIGNPLGFEQTVSDGIISGIRQMQDGGKIIQISAPISEGSSGSPVVNMKGEVVGVAAFIMAEGQNLNFAIHSERITKLKPGKKNAVNTWTEENLKLSLASLDNLMNTDNEFMGRSDYENEIQRFKKIIKNNPRSVSAYVQMGYCLQNLQHYPEAIKSYLQAINISPVHSIVFYNLGICYSELNNYEQGIKAFNRALKLNPEYTDAFTKLGEIYIESGYYENAVNSFEKVLQIKPEDAPAYYNLGLAYYKLGMNEKALKAFETSARINPSDSNTFNNIGNVFLKLKRLKESVSAYKHAVKLQPDNADLYYNIGLAFNNSNLYHDEIKAYKKAIKINPGHEQAYNNLGIAYGNVKKFIEAINSLSQAVKINPEYDLAYFNLGIIYTKIGSHIEAVEAYKNAIRIKPLNSELHFHLGIAYNTLNLATSSLIEYNILKDINATLAEKLFSAIYKK